MPFENCCFFLNVSLADRLKNIGVLSLIQATTLCQDFLFCSEIQQATVENEAYLLSSC